MRGGAIHPVVLAVLSYDCHPERSNLLREAKQIRSRRTAVGHVVAQTQKGILTRLLGENSLLGRFQHLANTGSFDCADSPLRGESAALRMTGLFCRRG